MPKLIPSDIEFAIASGGGVATSMLGEFFPSAIASIRPRMRTASSTCRFRR